jgi:hypothetical protein
MMQRAFPPGLEAEIDSALDPAVRVDEARGCATFTPGDLSGFDRVREICAGIFALRESEATDASKKKYLRPMLDQRDIDGNPDLIGFALNPKLLAAASLYFGAPASLRSVQYYYTPQNTTEAGSQMLHFDHIGERQLKLFIYLAEVEDDTGPFVFIPADASSRVLDSLGLTWDEAHVRRFEDDEVAAIVPAGEMVTLKGPAGAGGMVDTTRCLHYGGRARRGERHMLIIQYTRPGDAMDVPIKVHPRYGRPSDLTALQQRALEAA